MMIDAALAVGDEPDARVFGPITRTDIVRYQGASGDLNPIHHDDEYARKAGYPSVFSVGMLQAGLIATFATDWLGAENIRRFAVRFHQQVWPGDLLTCSGSVTAIETVAEGECVSVDLRCTRAGGGVVITGEATFVVAH